MDADLSLERAVALFHHRYAVPAVAALHRAGEMTTSELAVRLRGSRAAIGDALADLGQKGLVEAATTGRPRRYRLSSTGALAGPASSTLAAKVSELDVYPVALRKWSMPVVYQVGRGLQRYNEIEASLPRVNPRALALALREVLNAGLAERSSEPSYAGARVYALTPRGRDLFEPLEAFVECVGALPD